MINIEETLHPRLIETSLKLFNDEYFSQAAFEALREVEIVLKEKSGEKKFGNDLINTVLGDRNGIKLVQPLNNIKPQDIKRYFEGTFAYYRNYLAHDGSNINKKLSSRILIISSELLDILDASKKSFKNIGGVKGLIDKKIFPSEENLINVLNFLDEYFIIDDVSDGFYYELAEFGCGEEELDALFDLDLIKYESNKYIPNEMDMKNPEMTPEDIGTFQLTKLGKEITKTSKMA